MMLIVLRSEISTIFIGANVRSRVVNLIQVVPSEPRTVKWLQSSTLINCSVAPHESKDGTYTIGGQFPPQLIGTVKCCDAHQ